MNAFSSNFLTYQTDDIQCNRVEILIMFHFDDIAGVCSCNNVLTNRKNQRIC